MTTNALLEVQHLELELGGRETSLTMNITIAPGLTAVIGGERVGKTSLLRALSQPTSTTHQLWTGHPAAWLDLELPGHDQKSALQIWQAAVTADWSPELVADLVDAWDMQAHIEKPLYMLSKGHRRKVGLVALLAANHTITCLDMPCAALDMRSIVVLRELLTDAARHPSRAWIVADYEADATLPWTQIISL